VSDAANRSYAVTAEFYDVLHARTCIEEAERLLDRWLGQPAVGVLDVGAGTGLATLAVAARCGVAVHAVEPATSMRAVLLSRIASQHEPLERITVHAAPIEGLGLCSIADFALCLNTMSTLDESARRRGLGAIARALVAGGRFVVQRPPTQAVSALTALPTRQVGVDRYGGETQGRLVGGHEVEWTYTYRVTRGNAVIREATESFRGYLVPPARFDEELRAAGLEPEATDEPDIVIARRAGR
jgi:SAM-dependent methyltransferase